MRYRIRLVALFLALLATPQLASSSVGAQEPQQRIDYLLRMSNPSSHLFEVSITASASGAEPVDFQMPAWSPGRYVIYDFARNVQDVAARDQSGAPVAVVKLDKQTWRVAPRPESTSVVFTYRVFANNLSGTFSQLSERHANVNGASVFMYVVGRKPWPVRLTIEPPGGWKVVNGRVTSTDQRVFDTPNYDILIDTPTEIAPDFDIGTFVVDGREIRVVTHQLDRRHRTSPNKYVEDVERIVRAYRQMIEFPPDLERYTFLVHFAPGVDGGDGMEHLSSTQIIETSNLGDSKQYGDLLNVTAHEYFHLWNVKRLRPIELGPWDYTKENYTTSLWIAEGVTSYYDDLTLARAGLLKDREYLDVLANEVSDLQNMPGRTQCSAERASFDTWLFLAVRPRQATNLANTMVNYYTKGEVLGAMLDLEIRHLTNGARSLDDVMRLMFKRFYVDADADSYYLKGRGYSASDFLNAVNEVAGADLTEFFERYVSGTKEIDYDRFLGYAGLKVEAERRVTATDYDVNLENFNGRIRVSEAEEEGIAASGGLRRGDIILKIDNRPTTLAAAKELFEKGSIGAFTVTVERDRYERVLTIPGFPFTMVHHIAERPDATEAQRTFRRAWLSSTTSPSISAAAAH